MGRIVLLPTNERALAWKKTAAMQGASPFAAEATTFLAWFEELWGVWGDGRTLAHGTQKALALASALGQTGAFCRDSFPSSGIVSLFSRLVRGGLGTREFDKALEMPESLAPHQREMLEVVRAYEQILDQAGLVDPGRACAILSSQEVVLSKTTIELQEVDLLAPQRRFLESQPNVSLCEQPDEPVLARVAAGVELRFAFPSGRYAEPLLLADLIADCAGQGAVFVSARRPYQMYESVRDALLSRGLSCAVRDRIRFRDTDFGRSYMAAYAFCAAEQLDRAAASDYALSPYSGMSAQAAYAFDRRMRMDRLYDKRDCLMELRSLSPDFEYFEELFSSVEASIVVGVFEDRVRERAGFSEAYAREQLNALALVRDVYDSARALGTSVEACAHALESAFVDVSRSCGKGQPSAVFSGLSQAGSYGPRSFESVIACDMTSASYPVRDAHDAATFLLETLGIPQPSHALRDLRRSWSTLQALASKRFVIERLLHDADANPTYPSAVVEEFVDLYRADPTDTSDIDNPFALPPCLQEGMMQRGEEQLYENCAVSHGAQEHGALFAEPLLSEVSERARARLVLPRPKKGGGAQQCLFFSPSQIETYLECPQKWFASRRLRLDELDEQFGPVEMGDFSHRSLQVFYGVFRNEVGEKVTEHTLAKARDIMRAVTQERAARQFAMKPGNNRLVPLTAIEQREVEALCERLVGYLDREVDLLPDFHPAYFEYSIPVSIGAQYAGFGITGSIDRIDVDDRGRAVVIDYKSSLSADYDFYEPKSKGGAQRNGKVQTLIYAQLVRKLLGLDVVGALYVSYGRTPKAAGLIDASIEPSQVPGLRAETCVYRGEGGASFAEALDATEERVSQALARLLAGEIAPNPASDSVCSWCPETSCPSRKGR